MEKNERKHEKEVGNLSRRKEKEIMALDTIENQKIFSTDLSDFGKVDKKIQIIQFFK